MAGEVFGEDAAKGKVQQELDSLMGKEIAAAVEKMVENAGESSNSAWAPIVSVVLMVVAALGAFLHVRAPAEAPYLTKLFCSAAPPSDGSSGTPG